MPSASRQQSAVPRSWDAVLANNAILESPAAAAWVYTPGLKRPRIIDMCIRSTGLGIWPFV